MSVVDSDSKSVEYLIEMESKDAKAPHPAATSGRFSLDLRLGFGEHEHEASIVDNVSRQRCSLW